MPPDVDRTLWPRHRGKDPTKKPLKNVGPNRQSRRANLVNTMSASEDRAGDGILLEYHGGIGSALAPAVLSGDKQLGYLPSSLPGLDLMSRVFPTEYRSYGKLLQLGYGSVQVSGAPSLRRRRQCSSAMDRLQNVCTPPLYKKRIDTFLGSTGTLRIVVAAPVLFGKGLF